MSQILRYKTGSIVPNVLMTDRVGHLTIGVAGTFLAMKLLSALTQRHPGVQVSVLRGNSQEDLRLILNHRVDVGIFGYMKPDDRLHTIATHRHRLVLMVHREHWWACREDIRVRTHYSHQMTAAARAIAAMKFLMLRSKRVAIRRQSLRRQNMRSMMLRCL